MKAFTIDHENSITAFASAAEAKQALTKDTVLFTSEDQLARYAAAWPSARLMELWNALPGVTRVKKFTNRPTAIQRIWKAIQHLEPVPAPAAPPTEAEGEPTVRRTRNGTKRAVVLDMLARAEGVTVKELMAALRWQSHSVRGFLSNLNRSGRQIRNFKRDDGERAYSTAAAPATSDQEGQS